MKKSTINSRILHIFIVINILFLGLVVYMSYFELYGKDDIMANNYNRRLKAHEEGIIRGQILDRNGEPLATTNFENGQSIRQYPYKKLYAHVIGYSNDRFGKTLLEAQYNDTLLGNNALGLVGNTVSLIKGEEKTGNNLVLTIDHALQARARELLGDKRGAVVAIDPNTGEILAMVSTPDYNPNQAALEESWEELSTNENSPLLPRAVMGLYPPGSTFKVVTAVAAIEEDLSNFIVTDNGSTVIDGKTFSNAGSKAYGDIGLTEALTVSSNVYFSELSKELDSERFIETSKLSGMNQTFDFDIPMSKSKTSEDITSKTEYAATTIGQGKLLVTPLQMAMICSGIANEGIIMKPYLVKSVTDKNGLILTSTMTHELYEWTDQTTANSVKEMMVEVVKSGTGRKAALNDIVVAGKTGTAQNEKSIQGNGLNHAWFIGFAPADDPEIAIAVILENQEAEGGQVAAPIARKLINQWINGQ